MENKKTLLLFTGEFPYGKKGEPFLEDEIWFLANEFSNIYVFPRIKSEHIRELPTNVTVIDSLVFDSFRIGHQSISNITKSLFSLIKESILTKHGIKYLLSFRHFLYVRLEAEIIKKKLIDWYKRNEINNVLAYFYWSDTSLLAYALLKKAGINHFMVCRAHGFDLYDNRNIGGLIPFRLTMYNAVDTVYCISHHGKNYLLNKLPIKFHHKIKLSYLGVNAPKQNVLSEKEDYFTIVSCARMEGFKRISLIPKILQLMHTPIHWVHFGDGPEFEAVKQMIQHLPPQIKVTLKGQVSNTEIHRFYSEYNVDLFVSLSLSEGLPVSMMEALSNGIPILSTAVNGTPEIVTPDTGILISLDEPIDSIANIIESALKNTPFNKEKIKDFYFANFNAENNYRKFAKEISLCI